LFGDYVFAFELTSALLVIAVIGAVVMARRAPKESEQ
jgi:NADH:ubiquinone oxidoreductase subunit 6 (subunit J)